ncbi:FecCD family ABC transporter permease [Eubacterium oxidoreducens]|uniref:Iron complex transport system permease protein n=1 Tax=Eubacterium oxidoreducens TaxID=1732 RepID=A0A1G6BP18_EUBOX|nr:iron ABC transporter permease [Eubacterium oxidoreducens]SDB22317.1 iron complex transport system permease protein [Eubacterium oxidoreducens]
MRNYTFKIIVIIVILITVFLVSLAVGRYAIKPGEVMELLFHGITGKEVTVDEMTQSVFYGVRLPRAIAAVIIGAALSLSGAGYQGILRNPIVAPDILGASSGASLGAAIGIMFDLPVIGIEALAFAGGLLAVGIAFFISRSFAQGGHSHTIILVLTGMVVAAFFSAGISIIKYVGDPYDTLPALTFWLMGGLSYVEKSDLLVLLVPFVIGAVPLFLLRWKLNILCFSDEEAKTLGAQAGKVRGIVILCATLLTCSSVAVGGMIGWVGLVIPHIARMLTGPDFRKLLPMTAVIGGGFLLAVDDVARSVLAQEIPIGILTAIIGAPVFLYMLARSGHLIGDA